MRTFGFMVFLGLVCCSSSFGATTDRKCPPGYVPDRGNCRPVPVTVGTSSSKTECALGQACASGKCDAGLKLSSGKCVK